MTTSTRPDTTCDWGNHLMCIEDCPCSCHEWDAIREQQKARYRKDAQ